VKGAHLQAVYTKGRESVDMKAFHGYVVAHPEAATLIQTGAPSVSIRVAK
jgi:archaeosine-15-forming tRNA-guanine transglycosylase